MSITTLKLSEGKLESILKFGGSCTGKYGDDEVRVFMDSSVGCGLGCAHCWVADVAPKWDPGAMSKLDSKAAAVVGDRPCRLKFMGQGDPFANPKILLDRVNQFQEVSHVSLSTIMPKEVWPGDLKFKPDRIYISLVDPDPTVRSKYTKVPFEHALNLAYNLMMPRDVRIHYTPTADQDLARAVEIFKQYKLPIRLIRQHKQDGSPADVDVLEFAEKLVDEGVKVSVAISAGTSNNTACGMFG